MSERHHISDSDLGRYHFDSIRGPELAMVEEHLLWCVHCVHREEESCVAFRLKAAAQMDHIPTDVLELYHSGSMTDASDIARIEQHVSECRDCADRMLAIERFIRLHRSEIYQRRVR